MIDAEADIFLKEYDGESGAGKHVPETTDKSFVRYEIMDQLLLLDKVNK